MYISVFRIHFGGSCEQRKLISYNFCMQMQLLYRKANIIDVFKMVSPYQNRPYKSKFVVPTCISSRNELKSEQTLHQNACSIV